MVRGVKPGCVYLPTGSYTSTVQGERKDACGWNSFLSPYTFYIL